ncbi:hypothetical protein [Symbiopectobacterium purcellii]
MKFYNAYINQYLKLFNKAPITTPFFDVEPLFVSQMFSLHATGSPVGPER